jgi:hypothetical protein
METLLNFPQAMKTVTPIRQKRLKNMVLKQKKLSVTKRYQQFFSPIPSLFYRHDDGNVSLEQPSPLKWVPSETTYGIGSQ